jgi:hypothetical protein
VATAKPFSIPKREVWDAFQKVKANQGAAGVDGQTIAEFEDCAFLTWRDATGVALVG